jgi:hypothetical protein
MTTIYIASKFERQAEMKVYAKMLRANGHVVTSRWLEEETDEVGTKLGWQHDPARLQKFAQIDLDDIRSAHLLLIFTHEGLSRGGMHVEFGYGMALGKRLIVVGPRPTLFHFLPSVLQVDSWDEACALLGIVP